jgi:hypothetical protein
MSQRTRLPGSPRQLLSLDERSSLQFRAMAVFVAGVSLKRCQRIPRMGGKAMRSFGSDSNPWAPGAASDRDGVRSNSSAGCDRPSLPMSPRTSAGTSRTRAP